jgi:hypothetical protein
MRVDRQEQASIEAEGAEESPLKITTNTPVHWQDQTVYLGSRPSGIDRKRLVLDMSLRIPQEDVRQ